MINAKILCWLAMEYCYLMFNLLVIENDGTQSPETGTIPLKSFREK
jgi:hypothetical protein